VATFVEWLLRCQENNISRLGGEISILSAQRLQLEKLRAASVSLNLKLEEIETRYEPGGLEEPSSHRSANLFI